MKKRFWRCSGKRAIALVCTAAMLFSATGLEIMAEELYVSESELQSAMESEEAVVSTVVTMPENGTEAVNESTVNDLDTLTDEVTEAAAGEETEIVTSTSVVEMTEDSASEMEETFAAPESQAVSDAEPVADISEEQVSLESEAVSAEKAASEAEGEHAFTFSLGSAEKEVFELTPTESGTFEFAYASEEGKNWNNEYSLFSEGKRLVPSVEIYENWTFVSYAAFMMEAGKTYTLEITHGADYSGTLYLNKIDDPFTIEGTVLTSVNHLNLDYMILPEGITEISSAGISSIMNKAHISGAAVLPASLTKFYESSLWYCDLYVAEGSETFQSIDGVLFSADGETLVKMPANKSGAVIPGNPKKIGKYAFRSFRGSSEVVLPDSVEEIGEDAFWGSYITNIVFGSRVNTIGSYAFSGADLSSVELPDSLKTIGQGAFDDTPMTRVVLPEGLETIGPYAFRNTKFSALKFPDTIKKIDYQAFENTLIEEIELPASLEWIGSAFKGCSRLKKITINSNAYMSDVFSGVDNLEEIALGEEATRYSLTERGWLYRLGSDAIDPNTGTVIATGNYLIMIPGIYETEELDLSGFIGVNDDIYSHVKGVKKLIIGAKTVELSEFPLPELAEISVAEGNPVYYSQDNVLYKIDYDYGWRNDGLLCYPSGKEETAFTVPDFVGYIASGAFKNYSDRPRRLTSVTIPEKTKLVSWMEGVFSTENEDISEPLLTIFGYPGSPAYDYYLDHQYENLAWESLGPLTYTVTLDPAKGKVSQTELTVTPGEAYGTLPTPSRSNYYFFGWYNSAGERITASTIVSDESDHTLTAKWKKAEIGNTTVTVKNCTWNGKEQKPAVTVKLAGRTLKENTHYTLTYSKNKEPGTGKVVVKGKGIFKNSAKTKTATFTIYKKAQTITASNKTYASSKIGKEDTLSASVKEKAKLTFTSSNTKVVKIVDKNKGKIKIVGSGTATITIKSAATTHYKSGSKKITIKVKGNQTIKLTASFLKYNSAGDRYELNSTILAKSLGVKVKGNASYTCVVKSTGKGCLAWFTSGDKLTTEGAGTFTITVTAKATDDGIYPEKTETFTIKQKGVALTTAQAAQFTYRQIDANSAAIVKYLGNASTVDVPFTVTIGSRKKNITTIDANAFASKKMMTLTMKSGSPLKVISSGAFKNCASLKTLRLGTEITSLGKQAFYGCKSLKNVTLPDGIKTIGAEAFSGTALSGVLTLPSSLQKINTKAFYGCSKIKKLMVYNYLKTVGASAFAGCSGITDVYYSAADYRWKLIDFTTGNTAVTGAVMHFNAGAPPAAYEATDITDEMLLNNYPEALDNESYETITTELEDELLNVMISHTTLEESLAALKSEFSSGSTYAIKAIIEDAAAGDGGRTWTEKQVDRALALELLREASDVDQISSEVGDLLDEVYSGLKKLKPQAEKLVTDDSLCTEAAEQLYDSLKDHLHYSKEDYKKMLQTIGKYWERSEDYPEVTFSITDAFDAVDVVIDEADFIMDIITLMIIGEESVDRALAYAPEESGLYDGFLQLRTEMELPAETMILRLLTDEFLGELSKTIAAQIVGTSEEALFTVSKGALAAASTFYKLLGTVMDCPTIDSYNNAWISVRNTVYLHQIIRDLQDRLVLAKNTDNTELQNDYIYFVNMYFASLKSAGKYVASTMKDHDYLDQKMNRYKNSFTLNTFLRSCKENAAAQT